MDGCPSPRDKHCAAALDSRQLVVFGGFGPGGSDLLTSDEEDGVSSEDEIDAYKRQQGHASGSNSSTAPAACFTWFNDLFVFDTGACLPACVDL